MNGAHVLRRSRHELSAQLRARAGEARASPQTCPEEDAERAARHEHVRGPAAARFGLRGPRAGHHVHVRDAPVLRVRRGGVRERVHARGDVPLHPLRHVHVHLHHQPGARGPAVPVHDPLRGVHVLPEGLVLRGRGLPHPAEPGPAHHARQHLHAHRHVHGALPGRDAAAGHRAPLQELPQGSGVGGVAAVARADRPHDGHGGADHQEHPGRRRQEDVRAHLGAAGVQGLRDGPVRHQHHGSGLRHRIPVRPVGAHLPGVPAELCDQQRREALPEAEGSDHDLHHRAGVLGLLPALLDLAAAAAVPQQAAAPGLADAHLHQLPGGESDLQQQLHQPLPLHAAHQELPRVPEEPTPELLQVHVLLQEAAAQPALLGQVRLLQQPVRLQLGDAGHGHAQVTRARREGGRNRPNRRTAPFSFRAGRGRRWRAPGRR